MNYRSFNKNRYIKTAAGIFVFAAAVVTVVLALDMKHPASDPSIDYLEEKSNGTRHNLEKPVCMDIDPDENFIIGSGSLVYIISSDGSRLRTIDMGQPVKAVCPAPGFIYTAAGNSLYKINTAGNNEISIIADLGNESIVTSLEYKNSMLTAADAGNRLLYRFSDQGVLKKIISFDSEPSLFLPSPYLDFASLSDGRFWITNSGRHQLDLYSANGEYIKSCGNFENSSIFEGCCNPVKLEIIDANKMVTWEKGVKRLRILDFNGKIIEEIYTGTIFSIDEELIDMVYKNGSLYMLVHDSIYYMDSL